MSDKIDPDLYDLVDFRNDQIRGKSAYTQGVLLDENPNAFSKAPGNASWHAWREGWFMEHGKCWIEYKEKNNGF